MSDHLYPCFARADLAFSHGEGAWLIATDGSRYLDFSSGIAVTGLGHSHPVLVEELHRQGSLLWHVSNIVRIPEQEALADFLCASTFADRVFFNNSGAEAIETAIKTARRAQYAAGHPERVRVITFEGAFHGRTLATIAAGGRAEYLAGFGPVLPGFDVLPFGDMMALRAACTPETAAILLEPVQGESGIRRFSDAQLREIRQICDDNGLLLIFDEVQTGVGRSGHFFAYQASGVMPDLLATAKGLGNGFPVAACLSTEAVAAGMVPGTHGSTFGGNPLAMALSLKTVQIISDPAFLAEVRRKSSVLQEGLAALVKDHSDIFTEWRGEGMLLGLKTVPPVREAIAAARIEGLLTVAAGDNVMRLLPPLILSEADIDSGLRRLRRAALRLASGVAGTN